MELAVVSRGRIWIAVQAIGLLFAISALLLIAFSLVGESSSRVASRDDVPEGMLFAERVTLDGESITDVKCPSPWEWIGGERPSVCAEPVGEVFTVIVPTLSGVAIAGFGFWWLIGRHRRRVRSYGQPDAHGELLRYRVDTMPWSYWMALGGFGWLTVVIDIGNAFAVLREGDVSGLGGAIGFTVVTLGLVKVGHSWGYEMTIDGDQVCWRAPFRTTRHPIAHLRHASIVDNHDGEVGRHVGTVVLLTGQVLGVPVPRGAHAARWEAFSAALKRRNPQFAVPADTAQMFAQSNESMNAAGGMK